MRFIKYVLLAGALVSSGLNSIVYSQNAAVVWPNGAKAAVCLTYDDGLPSHIHTVGPMLKKYNIKATFFPTLASPCIQEQMEEWKLLAAAGHELGNHTLYHPCEKSEPGMEWIKNHLDLDHYTIEQILGEIQVANGFLQSLDGLKSRTFAYPCAHMHAGGINFKDSLSRFVTAARSASEAQPVLIPIQEIDLYNVPSWAPNNTTGKDLVDYLKKIIASKTLSTFTFHGVNGDHMAISKEAHEQMLQFLHSHRAEIWVTTFKEATDYLRKQR